MTTAPTLSDFEQTLDRICRESVEALGRETARITAEAAAQGALSNSRIVFLYTDALEESWRPTADRIVTELRRWTSETRLTRASLREVAERQLHSLAAQMVEMSRVRRAGRAFSNQAMLASAKQKIDALEPDIAFRLRQFDTDMDVARSPLVPRWKLVVSWVTKHVIEVAIGLVILVIAAAFGVNH